MKVWCYNEPVMNDKGKVISNKVIEVTEDLILSDFWNYWENQMIQKFGENHYMINPQQCIEDWVTIHWAWEKK